MAEPARTAQREPAHWLTRHEPNRHAATLYEGSSGVSTSFRALSPMVTTNRAGGTPGALLGGVRGAEPPREDAMRDQP
eukprot:9151683-Alexandrium_andersonii.AAC.1